LENIEKKMDEDEIWDRDYYKEIEVKCIRKDIENPFNVFKEKHWESVKNIFDDNCNLRSWMNVKQKKNGLNAIKFD
jgi:hypothetical protein